MDHIVRFSFQLFLVEGEDITTEIVLGQSSFSRIRELVRDLLRVIQIDTGIPDQNYEIRTTSGQQSNLELTEGYGYARTHRGS